MTSKKEWIEWYVWDKVRVRVLIERDKSEITDFVIQLELNENGWNAVVRYNFAHGIPHRDLVHKSGKREKLWLYNKTLREVFDYAKKDIMKNWRAYIKKCGYNEIE